MTNDIEILLDGLDENSIGSILKKWKEINTMKKKMEDVEEMLKTKVKIFLKERMWNKYLDEHSKISVTLTSEQREVIDKKQLRLILSESQISQVVRLEHHEKLMILTPEARERMRKYVKKQEV
jgi:hypothetical protein